MMDLMMIPRCLHLPHHSLSPPLILMMMMLPLYFFCPHLIFILKLFLLLGLAPVIFSTYLQVNCSMGKTSSSLSIYGALVRFAFANHSVTTSSACLFLSLELNLTKTKLCNFLELSLFLFFVWT